MVKKQITKHQARKAKSTGEQVLVQCLESVVIYIFVYMKLFELVQRCGINVLP